MIKRTILYLFTILGILVSSAYCGNSGSKKIPKAEKGVIDLRDWDFEKDGVLKLDGEWEFYWNRFLKSGQFETAENRIFMDVPSVWNGKYFNNEPLPYQGYSTYRLRLLTREDQNDLSLKIMLINSAFKLYSADVPSGGQGRPGKIAEETVPRMSPEIADLKNFEDKEVEIIIHVSNFHYGEGGIERNILIGKKNQIRQHHKSAESRQLIFFGMIFFIGIYHLGLYSMRKTYISAFYFGLFCIISSIRDIIVDERAVLSIFPEMPFWTYFRPSFICLYLMIAAFFQFLKSVFREDINENLFRFLVYYYLIASFLTLFLPPNLVLEYELFNQLIAILLGPLIFRLIYVSYTRKRTGTVFFMAGFAVFFLTGFNDILHTHNYINTGFYVQFGLAVFVTSQSFILSLRYSNAFKKAESLSIQLEKMGKVKDEFMSNLSHELRTPLSLIYAYAEMMSERRGKNEEDIRNFGKDILKEAGKLNENINDLMLLTDLESKFHLRNEKIKASEICRDCLKYLKDAAEEKNIGLSFNADEEIYFSADRSLISKALIILVKNGIIYNRPGGQVEVNVSQKNDKIIFSVMDNGIGISFSDQSRVFEKFYRVDSSVTYAESGVGIGLFIASRIAGIHSGEIVLESAPDIGTSVQFILPKGQTH